MTPCIVITRDRVTCLTHCLASLQHAAGNQHAARLLDVHIVDHGSTWPPMLDYLNQLERRGIPVHRRGDHPPRDLWTWDGLAGVVGDEPYLVTDPDIVLDCPPDWLGTMTMLLLGRSCGQFVKVGLGLRTDDLPSTVFATKIRQWESSLTTTPFEGHPDNRYQRAPVDTTLALYPPLPVHPEFKLGPAARLSAPYLIRHLPWYEAGEPGEELDYYREHLIPGSSHWAHGGW